MSRPWKRTSRKPHEGRVEARRGQSYAQTITPPGGHMAGLIQRASLLIKAKFSKLLDRAERPSETLDYSYERQVELLQGVRRGVADVVTAKKRLELQSGRLEKSLV